MFAGFLTLLIVCFFPKAFALDFILPISSIHNATNNLITLSESPSDSALNPAFIHSGFETTYSQLYGLSEIQFYSFNTALNINNYGVYLGSSMISHPFFKEHMLKTAIMYDFRMFILGVSNNLLYVDIDNYRSSYTYSADLGIKYRQDKIVQSIAYRNVFNCRILNSKTNRKFLWETGLIINRNHRIALGIEKEDNSDFIFKIAFKYDLLKAFAILAGYQYNPERISCGLLLHPAGYKLIYSVNSHKYLGETHFISLGYIFGGQ